MPIVDDPFDFGAIAATNAISDVYAMGGTPLFALALVAMPIDKLPLDAIRRILEGGESVCRRAGIPVAGGHSVDSVEPIYGLVAIGLVDPRHVKRNADAQPGDPLVLGKALGVGIYGAALKKQQIDRRAVPRDDRQHDAAQHARHASGATAGRACADRRHRLRPARSPAGGLPRLGRPRHVCDWSAVPLLTDARELAADGIVTGGSARNWKGYGDLVDLPTHRRRRAGAADRSADERRPARRMRARAVDDVLDCFRREGFQRAAVIGEIEAGLTRRDRGLGINTVALRLARFAHGGEGGNRTHHPARSVGATVLKTVTTTRHVSLSVYHPIVRIAP